ncbi:dimethylaniline monooxygenase [N-oxide-forming] 2-like isoform X2 [Pseudophryne corroboree]
MMCFTDYPMPQDFPAYLHNSKVLEYLTLYVDHFRLLKHIHFKTEVCHVTKSSDFCRTGQWEVRTEKCGIQQMEHFDAVLVCNGQQVDHYLPLDSFPGIHEFKGQYTHSRFYREPKDYHGKTVLVVGTGNSAGDISAEISHTAKQVYLSTRQGSWVVSRISQHGFPIDMVFSTRCYFWITNALPNGLLTMVTEKQMNNWFDHANYGLQPEDRSLLKEPIVNDYLPSQILCGAIRVKPDVRRFTESTVVFEDGTVVEDLDEVIFATGYSISFPFLDDSVISVDDNKVTLYKNVFPTRHEKPTLAFLGLVRPLGSLPPVSELQARWATRIFKGIVKLPSVTKMEAHYERSMERKRKCFGKGRSQTLQTYFIEYMDEIAVEMGICPNIIHLLLRDPRLAWNVFFGPCTPYQYRLTGPGKWSGAREAILTQWSRTLNPAKTRIVCRSTEPTPRLKKVLGLFGLLAAIFIVFYCVVLKTLI